MGGDCIQLIWKIIGIQLVWKHILVIVKEKLSGLYAAGGIAHDSNIIGMDAVDVGIFANKPYGPRDVQGAFLLGIGP